jgi:hypothetical protein
MGIARVGGRSFEAGDRDGAAGVAIVNQALARRYFPGEDPMGRRIRFYNEPAPGDQWLTIVGVVADEKRSTPYDEMAWADAPVVYQPLAQKPAQNEVYVLLRTRTGRSFTGAMIQQEIRRIDAAIVVALCGSSFIATLWLFYAHVHVGPKQPKGSDLLKADRLKAGEIKPGTWALKPDTTDDEVPRARR